ncbi:MAG: transporter suffix domain-containing protein [Bacteroidales bacterium]|nr:transporter suffix domain-containing protein [Bacteroidales bacterium]
MTKNNWKLRLGISLMIVSGFVFGSLLIIPFLNIDTKTKITATTIIIVIGEITFWSGGLLIGKEMVTKYKSYLNPKKWFKKKLEEFDD